MKNKLVISLLVFAAAAYISACKKEEPEPSSYNNPSQIDGGIFGSDRTVRVMGTVLDEAGNPLSGAEVSTGAQSTQTDGNGVFILENAPAQESLGYVTVSKPGYFLGSRSFVPAPGGNVVIIRMLPKTIIGSVNGAAGGTLQSEGVSLSFEANSFSKNGMPYAGTVHVAMAYIDPEGDFFAEEMPGNLLAVQNGTALGLTSYGMIGVELSDDQGGEVSLSENTTASVRFPVPAGLLNTAPPEIDLWSFDETKGYWIYEGQAILEGNEYAAEVAHFSFWNCDYPWPLIEMNGRVLDAAGNPVQGAKVTLLGANIGSGYDYTNTEGYFGGNVPYNTALTIIIEVLCLNEFVQVYTGSIVPFTSNVDLGNIQVPNTELATLVIGHVVDCDNNPITNAYVIADSTPYFLDNNGQFSFIECESSISISPHTLFESGSTHSFDLNGDYVNIGNLVLCSELAIGTLTDIEGNVYQTVVIGTQEWMAENLRTSTYSNGEEIPNVTGQSEWADLSSGAWCYFDNDIQYEYPFGKMYNWYAVTDPRNVCPTGWHVPSAEEFAALSDYLGGDSIAGGKLKVVGAILWNGPNAEATNESGFSAVPGGLRNTLGNFESLGSRSFLWSTTDVGGLMGVCRLLYHDLDDFANSTKNLDCGQSIRCLRD